MQNVNIEFSENLTVISGLNGTGKSSVLGLIGQVFDYKGVGRTINNRIFATKYSEIFKFCPKYDQSSEYEYTAEVLDGEEIIERKVKSRYVIKEKRFRMDIGEREKLKGALNLPVIYLGLKRFFPLAQELEGSISIKKHDLSSSEVNFYEDQARSIFVMLDGNVKSQDIKTPNKEFLAMHTKNYSNLGNSAGQDNIGQVITAVLSFRRLSNKVDYSGGILLIDELEATLFPGAQLNFLSRLFSYAKSFKLQIIFTTHSLEVIKFLQEHTSWNTKINFLEIRDGKVQNKIDPSFEYIKSRILIEAKENNQINKKPLICEDELAKIWANYLLNGHENKKWCEGQGKNLSDGVIKVMAESRMRCFKDFIFVLDGDGRSNSNFKKCKNVVFLPGEKRPETIFYEFLKSLAEGDDFWGGESHFYKDTCFNGFTNATTKSQHKAWFGAKRENFGRGCAGLFKRWKLNNVQLVEEFNSAVSKHLKTNI